MNQMDNFTADGIYIDAPPERVFEALSDPHQALVWLDAVEARIAPSEGGEFSARHEDGSTLSGRISELSSPLRLVIQDLFREEEGRTRGPMTMDFELIPRDTGVWINVRQDGLDAGSETGEWEGFALRTRRDLIQYTLRLKRHIEGI